MKRILLIISVFAFLVLGVIAWLFHPSPPPDGVTLSFAGYTNDARVVRSNLYRLPDSGSRSMALFELVNRTKHSYFCFPGAIQLQTGGHWIYDTNWAGYALNSFTLRPAQIVHVEMPVPAGSNSWRCSVTVLDVTYARIP